MLLTIHPDNPNPREINKVIACLKNGGIIIFPTDTVYALGCSIYNAKAVERVCHLKGVKLEKSNFSFICYDLSHISDFTKPFDRSIYKLLNKALPGPFTFILNANNNVPALFKHKKKTLGIRIPDNNIARMIVKELGNPLMSTSLHDEDAIIEYSTDPELLHDKYEKLVDILIDGGHGGIEPSTIIDCITETPTVVRQGKGEIWK